MVRDGLRELLERGGLDVVAQADDTVSAVCLSRMHRPDVAVINFETPPPTMIDCAREIIADSPKTGVVLVMVHIGELEVGAALRAGVRGCIAKTETSTELIRAIREVSGGGTFLNPKVSHLIARMALAESSRHDLLTPRLREVLRLIAEEKRTREIAKELGVSEKTAELYRARLMARLDIHDTAGLVRYAIRAGVVRP